MPRHSLDQLIERRQSEATDDDAKYVDLQLDLIDDSAPNQPRILRGGGRWSRRLRKYIGHAPRGRDVRCHPGQVEAARWFAAWIARWWRHRFHGEPIPDDERIYSLFLAGGQRSGKTWLGVALAVLYAAIIPGSIVWIVCPTENDFEEVEDYLKGLMPKAWYRRLGWPHWRYTLANGSKIVLRSGHKPEGLKKGDCDFLVINEAQQQRERVFNIARLRIARSGALVVACCNPPEQPVGFWVGDRVAAAERGEIQAKYFHVDPMDNPHIDHGPMLSFKKEVDDRTFDIEVRGLFLGARDAVFHNWGRLENEKDPPPRAMNVTQLFTRSQEGRAYDQVVGIDIQRRPMVGVEFNWFKNPRASLRLEDWHRWVLMWAVREYVLDRSDEEGLSLAMLEAGLNPERTLLVVDASGDWQRVREGNEGKMTREFKKEIWKGRGSFDVFHDHGFHHIVKPDRRSDANPDIVERFTTARQRICTAAPGQYGQRFLYSATWNRKLNEAVRGYPNKDGVPARRHKHAHLSDAFTYPVFRYYPRIRLAPPPPETKVLEEFKGRERTRGY